MGGQIRLTQIYISLFMLAHQFDKGTTMIEKITELEKNRMWAGETAREILCDKINELVDYVNTLCQEHDIHEKQIDDLQIKTDGIIDDIEHLEKHNPCQHEPFDYIGVRPSMAQVSNAEPPKTTYNVATGQMEPKDPYAEQRKWIGCLVRYKICDFQGGWNTDVLDEIIDHPIYPFKMRNGDTAQVCEVVEPSEIYPNKARTY